MISQREWLVRRKASHGADGDRGFSQRLPMTGRRGCFYFHARCSCCLCITSSLVRDLVPVFAAQFSSSVDIPSSPSVAYFECCFFW